MVTSLEKKISDFSPMNLDSGGPNSQRIAFQTGGASPIISKKEENQLLQRLNNEVAALHGKVQKQSTEMIEFVNMKLNDYATQNQVASLRTQMTDYTPLDDFLKLKESVYIQSIQF